MNAKQDTTIRLNDTTGGEAPVGVTAIRWRMPDGRVFYAPLDRERLTIGRGEGHPVRLDASGVSRSHAEIRRQGPVHALHDLGSTNGSIVNGRRVAHVGLSPGDVLRLGDVVGVLVRTHAAPSDHLFQLGSHLVYGPGLAQELGAMRQVAPTKLPVIIQGETGSGKEGAARVLHHLSGRTGPFHAVNCAALPPGLAEAELFGHRRGAFTGADQAALGHFRAAQGGTLFLDELAELPTAIQAKLLRVLQEGEVTPLGETRTQPLDLRVLAAVQEPLETLVNQKRLRDDLAMRLRGFVLVLPPLRDRRVDIAVLFDGFLQRHSGGRPPMVEPRLLETLLLHDWPGNVRELELATRQLLTLHGHEPMLRRGMLPEPFQRARPLPEARASSVTPDRREHDLQSLTEELKKNGGNLAQAAASIGISRQRAYRLLSGRTTAEVLREMEPPPREQDA